MSQKKLYTLIGLLSVSLQLINAKEAFLLIMGPSGVGKSTIINHLKQLDSRFTYISPFTTRPLRDGETDKVHLSLEEIEELQQAGKLLTVNQFYGIYYATPKYVIDEALTTQKFPVLDWPIAKIDVMNKHYENKLFKVYIAPENAEELKRRLTLDNRDTNGSRLVAGLEEIDAFTAGLYDQDIDLKVINQKDSCEEIAYTIYKQFLNFLNE